MKYFTFQEFERSAIATKFAIDNTMPESAKKNVAALVDTILDPLREDWGGPIDISGGYRCKELNDHPKVKGSKTSQHMTGEAADLRIYVRDENGKYVRDENGDLIVDVAANRKLFQRIQDLKLPYDQLIDENNFSWVHVSHRVAGNNRGQILNITKS